MPTYGKGIINQGYTIRISITRGYIEAISKQVGSKGESDPE